MRKKPRRCHINHQYQSSRDKGESDWWSCVSKLSKLFRGIYKWHLQQSSLNASNGWRWDLTHGMTERSLTPEIDKESVLPTLIWWDTYVKLLKADYSNSKRFCIPINMKWKYLTKVGTAAKISLIVESVGLTKRIGKNLWELNWPLALKFLPFMIYYYKNTIASLLQSCVSMKYKPTSKSCHNTQKEGRIKMRQLS